jgi:hypothetical protein
MSNENIKTPHKMAEDLILLSEQYSRYSGEFAEHIKLQADFFNTFRTDHKSDTATQRAFDATPAGVKLVILKLKLKALEKQMSATRTFLRLAENEAHGIY